MCSINAEPYPLPCWDGSTPIRLTRVTATHLFEYRKDVLLKLSESLKSPGNRSGMASELAASQKCSITLYQTDLKILG